jgi:cell division inhibitor SepF
MEDDYDEDEELYDEDDAADMAPPPPVREEPVRRREHQEPPRQQQPQANPGGKVVNIHATTQIQVVLVKPKRYDNAAEIANHLRDKRTVVLNLEETDENVARRLLDFVSGVVFSEDGHIMKVATNVFVVAPYFVDLNDLTGAGASGDYLYF